MDKCRNKISEFQATTRKLELQIKNLESSLEVKSQALSKANNELDRTEVNMNVLISKISAQNDALDNLNKTRSALEKELASKYRTIADLKNRVKE